LVQRSSAYISGKFVLPDRKLYIEGLPMTDKQPGKPLLLQETGLQRELNFNEIARRTTEKEAALLDRKIAASFVQGAGAIEWLWNNNSYMTERDEKPFTSTSTAAFEYRELTERHYD
jgi:hypothetical protein